MPCEFIIEPDQNLIRERYSGEVTLEELLRASSAEWADPLYRKGMHVLSDFRGAQITLTFEQMAQYAGFIEQRGAAGRQAIVVSGELQFGLARMFEQLTEGRGRIWSALRIFRDIAAAERWVLHGEAGPAT